MLPWIPMADVVAVAVVAETVEVAAYGTVALQN